MPAGVLLDPHREASSPRTSVTMISTAAALRTMPGRATGTGHVAGGGRAGITVVTDGPRLQLFAGSQLPSLTSRLNLADFTSLFTAA